ncbi:MAG: S1 RNA-binding domain-containing protein, partial [Phycisphaerales bacterium]|nr:S1 RNA-binding domain-containing protein [Phycisphaerales bacterium]
EGDVASGRVTKLMEFGAFVEIAEGIEGLVHISELSWQRVAKTSDAIQPNAVVQVKVLKIDPDARKISLSVKQTKEQPAREGGAGGPGGGGRGGKGRGRDRGEKDTRTPEEILKETPALRRLREKAQQKAHSKSDKGGLGSSGGLGIGLGDLSL